MKSILNILICFFMVTTSYADVNKTKLSFNFETGLGVPNYLISIQDIQIGNRQVPLMLDTGMGSGEILFYSNSDIDSSHWIFTHKKIRGVNVKGQSSDQIVIIPELKIGQFIVKNVKGVILSGEVKDHVPAFYNEHMNKTQSLKNGVIGLAFLQRFNLLINYPEKQVVLYKQEVVPAINLKSWIRIPFSTKNGFIETDASIDRVKLRLAWDTGFAPSRLKPFNQFKKHIEVCPSNYDIFGKSLVCYTSRQISMSNVKIPNTVFLYTDLNLPNFVPIDGFIGTNFYYKHAVFFDFKNHVMYIRDVHKA